MVTPALSPREEEVARALAAGLTQKEIAAQIGLSTNRVREITARIRLKLGAATTAAAIYRLRKEAETPV
jgi:LuxR family quorum sensing-dependent transcriptional regulator